MKLGLKVNYKGLALRGVLDRAVPAVRLLHRLCGAGRLHDIRCASWSCSSVGPSLKPGNTAAWKLSISERPCNIDHMCLLDNRILLNKLMLTVYQEITIFFHSSGR